MSRVVWIALLLPLCGCPTDSTPPDDSWHRVLAIGIDGTRPDALDAAYTPAVDKLLDGGAYSLDARVHEMGLTSSGPGWMSILTGVDADKHGVLVNGAYADIDPAYPTFLARARENLGLRTALAVQWVDILSGLVEEDATDDNKLGTDAEIAEWTAAQIEGGDHDLLFVVFDDVDHAGHEFGFDPTSVDYLAAIDDADAHVGTLLDAIEGHPADESWLVLVTTDHGGDGTEHGQQIEPCQRIFLIVSGNGVVAGELPAVETTHMDLHPTVMRYLGAEVGPDWDLDGVVRGLP